jgi:membrane protein DedA with SNARE-associated domain
MDSAAFWFYLGIFGLLLAAGLGFPIPEELPIVLAGAAVGHASEEVHVPPEFVTEHMPKFVANLAGAPQLGFPANLPWAALGQTSLIELPRASPLPPLHWWIMLPVCILGVVISDGFLYCVGRFGGRRLFDNRWVKRFLTPEKHQRIEQNFHKYGILVLLFARFLPAIRSPIFITAGILRLPFPRFLAADGIYAIPGVSLLFFLAFWFGDKFRDLVETAVGRVEKLKPLLILLVLTAIGSYLVYHFLRHPVATGDPREEVPLVGEKIASKVEHTSGKVPVLRDGELKRPDNSEPAHKQEPSNSPPA